MLFVQVFLNEKYNDQPYTSLIYTGEFKYNVQFHALIATACDYKPVEKDKPEVKTQCEKETQVASDIIKFVLSNITGDVNDKDNKEFLECIKTRIIDTITTTAQ